MKSLFDDSKEKNTNKLEAMGIKNEARGNEYTLRGIMQRGQAYTTHRKEYGGSHEEIGIVFGVKRSTIGDYLKIYEALSTSSDGNEGLQEEVLELETVSKRAILKLIPKQGTKAIDTTDTEPKTKVEVESKDEKITRLQIEIESLKSELAEVTLERDRYKNETTTPVEQAA